MLKRLFLKNWKSFRYAELPLYPLTVLIGTNASGKSNLVEAFEFLKRIVDGHPIETALAGDKILPPIRGGISWAALKPESEFTIKAAVEGEGEQIDYLYAVTVETKPDASILEEKITCREYQRDQKTVIFERDFVNSYIDSKDARENILKISTHYKNARWTLPNNDKSILTYFKNTYVLDNVSEVNHVIANLEKIYVLNPIPAKMRGFSRLAKTLESDASNLAGVIAGLSSRKQDEVENTLSEYARGLPAGNILKVWAERVGRYASDAMLYCEEEWVNGQIQEIDARSMSDGTLRFIAIVTALLTIPERSQLVLEDVDNGLHPSRTELLARMLHEIGRKREIDILVTTHNPALLDAFGSDIVPSVVVVHRDISTGESRLTRLKDIESLPKLMVTGALGQLATEGAIERSLADGKIDHQRESR
ncbi:AAA family ATPase [Calothrix sp. UHCC 0171]|uniref:AAA family ATPase n=1 Tax=Calothrix sp. UHCC 0171 TaxID=3110245 RepID=UPI002B2115D5|nr:AAA family ATPase [Calothrix sp. UHCC 0171]MEA5569536.1 AAA family ATPase [Calothrix sp. UHCC 0171]